MLFNAAEHWSVMATRDHEMSSDDDDDNAEVTAEMPETANETDQQSTLSPWVVAKVRLKVGAGKKNAGKPSKRRAGGGKARKKSLSKAGPDEQKMMLVGGGGGGGGQHQPPASPAPAGSDVVAELPPTSSDANNKSVQQRRGTDDRTDEEKEALRKAINIMYVTYIFITCCSLPNNNHSFCFSITLARNI